MIWKIITSIIMWLIYAILGISSIIVLVVLWKILVWDNIKHLFKKRTSDEKALENLNKYKTFGDVKKSKF